jgi:hypothetical protein
MVMLLLKALGFRRLTGWALRLIKLALVLALVVVVGIVLVYSEDLRAAIVIMAVVGIGFAIIRTLLLRHEREKTVVGERTIDGKVVPELLAVAALDIPEQSPDADYVLRGLPDYGKLLLKLDPAEFAYIPEPTTERVPEQPPVEPVVNRRWFGVPRRMAATGLFVVAATLLVVAAVGTLQGNGGARRSPAPIQNGPQTVAAADRWADFPAKAQPQPPASQPAPVATTVTAPALPTDSPTNNAEAPRPAASSPPQRTAPPLPADDEGFIQPRRAPAGTWRDVITELLWTAKDNGPEPLESLQAAKDYCEALDVGGLTGWRLPKYHELGTAWKVKSDIRLPGGIRASHEKEFFWSSNLVGKDLSEGTEYSEVVWTVQDDRTIYIVPPIPPKDQAPYGHAICVHN